MKLYFAPRTRSVRPRWLLEELEVPYELIRVDPSAKERSSPHPFGEVPVLIDGEVTLFESPAICLYLADRFAEKRLAPAPGSPERGPYLQWLVFAEATLEPLVLEHYRNGLLPEAQRADLTARRAHLDAVLTVIDTHVGGRPFVAGGAFSAADLVLASILHLANTLKLLDRHPRVVELVYRHTTRAAARRAVSP